MSQQTAKRHNENVNVCCPELLIADCAETKEHHHLICGYSNTILSNDTIKDLCIGDKFKHCINIASEVA